MKISFRWLEDLIPALDLTPEEVAARLAARGAPVEEVRSLGEGLGGIIVGRVERVREHPNADRLLLCDVDVGGGSLLQVVCGAPNVTDGGFYPFAPVGSTLPGGMEIEEARIRGESSEGMLLSERELELGPDHEGLMELPEIHEPGSSFSGALGLDDVRLEVEVTPNRGDLLSHLGLAREVAPDGVHGTRLPELPGVVPVSLDLRSETEEVEGGGVRVRVDAPERCPRYLAAVVRGVEVGPSPPWLASRLRAVGGRPINNVVDATNYVLLERGQPLHAFDLSMLEESTVVVRRSRKGETLRTLDGMGRTLDPEMLAICDAEKPVALAGVIGGEESEVTEGTTDLLLECALFDPKSVRTTRTALGLSTDASYRFERGVDPEGMVPALRRLVELILATAGGEAHGEILDVAMEPWTRPVLPLRPSRVEQILGLPFEGKALRDLLDPLGFEVRAGEGGVLDVEVPGFRSWDVTREVDLVEEVARTYGYHRFPEELDSFRPGTVPDHSLFQLEDDLRGFLVGRGFFEAQTPGFAPEEEGEVSLRNPISAEESGLRTSLVPGLLRRVEYNFARGAEDIRLFEIGTVFRSGDEGGRPREETRIAVTLTGRRAPPHWSGPGEAVDVWDLKSLFEDLVEKVGFRDVVVESGVEEAPLLHSGFGFTARPRGGSVVGRGGRVRDGEIDAPAWAGAVWVLELTLPSEPSPRPSPTFEPLPSFPGIERDLALLLPRSLPASRVRTVIEEAGGALLEEVGIFDLYEGEEIPEDTRSVAFRLHFRSARRTLKDAEVEDAVNRVVSHLKEELGVEPRGG